MKDFSRRLKKLEALSGGNCGRTYVLVTEISCPECGGEWQNDAHYHKYGCPCLVSHVLLIDKEFDVTGRSVQREIEK